MPRTWQKAVPTSTCLEALQRGNGQHSGEKPLPSPPYLIPVAIPTHGLWGRCGIWNSPLCDLETFEFYCLENCLSVNKMEKNQELVNAKIRWKNQLCLCHLVVVPSNKIFLYSNHSKLLTNKGSLVLYQLEEDLSNHGFQHPPHAQ